MVKREDGRREERYHQAINGAGEYGSRLAWEVSRYDAYL